DHGAVGIIERGRGIVRIEESQRPWRERNAACDVPDISDAELVHLDIRKISHVEGMVRVRIGIAFRPWIVMSAGAEKSARRTGHRVDVGTIAPLVNVKSVTGSWLESDDLGFHYYRRQNAAIDLGKAHHTGDPRTGCAANRCFRAVDPRFRLALSA